MKKSPSYQKAASQSSNQAPSAGFRSIGVTPPDSRIEPLSGLAPGDIQVHSNAPKPVPADSSPVIQRVVTSATANAATAPLANAALIQWIRANASPKTKAIANHADINLNIVWDGTLAGALADTDMNISWADNVAGPQGPLNLFNAANAAAIGAINFTNLTGYDINIPMRIRMPQPAPGTWQGTLIHELEAHTGLAYTTSEIIDKAKTDRRKRANVPTKITATMDARDVVAEHRNWASGGGGSEDSMTRVVKSAPRTEQVAIVIDIAKDRIREALDNWPVATPDTHRLSYNTAITRIKAWLRLMKTTIKHPVLSLADAALIDAEIANAVSR